MNIYLSAISFSLRVIYIWTDPGAYKSRWHFFWEKITLSWKRWWTIFSCFLCDGKAKLQWSFESVPNELRRRWKYYLYTSNRRKAQGFENSNVNWNSGAQWFWTFRAPEQRNCNSFVHEILLTCYQTKFNWLLLLISSSRQPERSVAMLIER